MTRLNSFPVRLKLYHPLLMPEQTPNQGRKLDWSTTSTSLDEACG
eukprot:CAMPEP_0181324490 /NCGR_PEP_ID=MMETSP1101-20121128/20389_1 /TAXON_ID=46948 /ORGANISM="Rhodomonas abbreviata, Strain Caron Lab Isolate" /LENGTH=44 /DNA_ID= /DNA_START= /DNA_END= /DNA_ORIENTATION=